MGKQQSNDNDKKASGKEAKRKGHPFLFGILIGLVVGVGLGWWFRPPESFPMEDLKRATESKLQNATEDSKEKLADWVETMADRLRRD